MEELIFSAIEEIVFLAIIIVLAYITQFIRKKMGEEKFETVQAIVEDGVLFAQQVYEHTAGEVKFVKAIEYVTEELQDRGIKVEEEQIGRMIESVLKRLKKEFGDYW